MNARGWSTGTATKSGEYNTCKLGLKICNPQIIEIHREEEERSIKDNQFPLGVIDTTTLKKSQVKRSRTAPSSKRRLQIEAVINHASAEWNRTTAIAPYRVLCWSSTTVRTEHVSLYLIYRPPALAPGWRSVVDGTMSQQCGMEPSHGPLQGLMLVSHYELLNTSLAVLHENYSADSTSGPAQFPPSL